MKKDHNDVAAYIARGNAYDHRWNKGDKSRAIADYKASLRIAPYYNFPAKDALERLTNPLWRGLKSLFLPTIIVGMAALRGDCIRGERIKYDRSPQ
jgi:hypothetical protein